MSAKFQLSSTTQNVLEERNAELAFAWLIVGYQYDGRQLCSSEPMPTGVHLRIRDIKHLIRIGAAFERQRLTIWQLTA